MVAGEVDFSNHDDFGGSPSDNGAITLKWEHPSGTEVEVQQSEEVTFAKATTRYKGGDPASVITGLPEGSHFFRIRQVDGAWSPPLEVRVEFFPRPKLFLLLGIGGVVVVATIATIVLGALKSRREEAGV